MDEDDESLILGTSIMLIEFLKTLNSDIHITYMILNVLTNAFIYYLFRLTPTTHRIEYKMGFSLLFLVFLFEFTKISKLLQREFYLETPHTLPATYEMMRQHKIRDPKTSHRIAVRYKLAGPDDAKTQYHRPLN